MGTSMFTILILRPFCDSKNDFTLITLDGLLFSICDLTISILEIIPMSFLFSSTTGRFLNPYLNNTRVASLSFIEAMTQTVPRFMTSLIVALGRLANLSSSFAVTNPRRYPRSVIGNPWKLELHILSMTSLTVISGLTVSTSLTM